MSVVDLSRQRVTRFAEFVGVGGVGMAIDLAVTFTLLSSLPPVLANACGFAVAVTHNFVGNYLVTFDRPDGSLGRQYGEYVAVHSLTFGVRAIVLSVVLAATPLPATVATVLGVGAAVLVNFLASERIFDGDGMVGALNHLAHIVWSSRLRALLVATGLYPVVFATYARVLAVATDDTQAVGVGGVEASIATATPTETVSVLHTLENEREVLRRWVADVTAGDRVLDVGANVGVFTALATAQGADVTAVEAHPPTAARCRENCPDATVYACALGRGVGTVGLDVTNDAAGTQRPAVGGDTVTVRQLPGDRLRTPDVCKIDVEGAETAVIDGFARTLAVAPPRVMYVEAHGERGEAAVRRRLRTAGYDEIEALSVGADETMLRATGARPDSPDTGGKGVV